MTFLELARIRVNMHENVPLKKQLYRIKMFAPNCKNMDLFQIAVVIFISRSSKTTLEK